MFMNWYNERCDAYGSGVVADVLASVVGMGLEIGVMDDVLGQVVSGNVVYDWNIKSYVFEHYGSVYDDGFSNVNPVFDELSFSRFRNGICVAMYDYRNYFGSSDLVECISSWRDELSEIRLGLMGRYGLSEEMVLDYRRNGMGYLGFGSY